MKEIWKPVKGFEDYYKVSNLGRVKSLSRVVPFGSQQRTVNGKFLSQIDHGNGYVYVTFSTKNKHKNKYVHRIVCESFKDNPNKLEEVNHIDGNKQNNCIENLEWITGINNKRHAMKTGLSASGSKKTTAKLSRAEARQIKREKLVGIPSKIIATNHEVSIAIVNSIGINNHYFADTDDIPIADQKTRIALNTWFRIKHGSLARRGDNWRANVTIDNHRLIDKPFKTQSEARNAMKKAFVEYQDNNSERNVCV